MFFDLQLSCIVQACIADTCFSSRGDVKSSPYVTVALEVSDSILISFLNFDTMDKESYNNVLITIKTSMLTHCT